MRIVDKRLNEQMEFLINKSVYERQPMSSKRSEFVVLNYIKTGKWDGYTVFDKKYKRRNNSYILTMKKWRKENNIKENIKDDRWIR